MVAPVAKIARKLQGFGFNNVSIIPTGIDLEKFKLDNGRVPILKAKLGIPPDYAVLVTVCRLSPEKNVIEQLGLLKSLLQVCPNTILLIVGDGPERDALEQKTSQLGLGGNVVFVGLVQPSEVQDYYHLGDLFISTSNGESQGLTYAEAFASSLPVICKEVGDGCLTGILKNGFNGYMFKSEEEFTNNVSLILKNPKILSEMSINAGHTAKCFSGEKFGNDIFMLYQTVLAKRGNIHESIT
jgi:1,2-diacylglycerol 3-alpha-glucosyltransferase